MSSRSARMREPTHQTSGLNQWRACTEDQPTAKEVLAFHVGQFVKEYSADLGFGIVFHHVGWNDDALGSEDPVDCDVTSTRRFGEAKFGVFEPAFSEAFVKEFVESFVERFGKSGDSAPRAELLNKGKSENQDDANEPRGDGEGMPIEGGLSLRRNRF